MEHIIDNIYHENGTLYFVEHGTKVKAYETMYEIIVGKLHRLGVMPDAVGIVKDGWILLSGHRAVNLADKCLYSYGNLLLVRNLNFLPEFVYNHIFS
jgi:hypothetical protein